MIRYNVKIGSIVVEFDKVGKRTWDINSAWKKRCGSLFSL